MSVTTFTCTERRYLLLTRVIGVVVAFATGCVSGPLGTDRAYASDPTGANVGAAAAHTMGRGAMDPQVPTPESIIGHEVGDGAVRYDPLVRYLEALADASPHVTLTPYAESHEGRTLYYLTVTSEGNHANLDQIKSDNAKLADPRRLSGDAEAQRLVEDLPGIAWLAYAIHGDELSSTDAAIEVAYQLAAGTDDRIRRLRDELVIHIDPLMNPDGRERYLGQLQHLTGKVLNPDYQAMQHWGLWSAGRGNHYLFDLNRDWVMQVHPETRGRANHFMSWNPHLLIDSHEMGSLDTYLFDPPREPHNNNLSASNLKWRRQFSKDQAKAFDGHGWSYYTKDWYEEWYPGYANAWASLQGSIGLLYEQAGVQAASVKKRAGDVLTYREAVHHQIVSSFANVETLREHRRSILADYLADRQWAVSEGQSSSEFFLIAPPEDRPLMRRFVDVLSRQGIEWSLAAEAFTARDVVDTWGNHTDGRLLPAGTLMVPAAQPHRRLLMALLEFDPRMTDQFLLEERRELENHRGTKVYDVTAWNLSMACGLEAHWAGSLSEVGGSRSIDEEEPTALEAGTYGYLIDGRSSDIYLAVARLTNAECKLRVATEPFTTSRGKYQRGTLLLRNHENGNNLRETLATLTQDLEVDVQPVNTALNQLGPDLGGGRFRLLAEPRIAIACQWPVSTSSFGTIWHLLDARIGLRVSPVNLQAIGMIDLRKYNVLVLPHTWGARRLGAVLDDGVRQKLKSWMEAGGTLVAIGGAAVFLADEDKGLSSVRLRRNVLDELPVYVEALERERAARKVKVDPAVVWDGAEAQVEDDSEEASDANRDAGKKKAGPTDLAALKRQDAWERTFRPDGAIGAATIDPEHWLCFGLPDDGANGPQLPVLLSGSHVFVAKRPVATPVRLADEPDLRLSGLMWPEARRRLANSAYATVERVGYGQIILFSNDPFFRGYFEGTGRLLLNALLLGPGMGTSQPAPW